MVPEYVNPNPTPGGVKLYLGADPGGEISSSSRVLATVLLKFMAPLVT